jgi:membrane protein
MRTLAFIKALLKKFEQDDCLGLAAEMAYGLMLALFPAMLLFVSFLSLIQSADAINLLSDMIGQVLPKEVYNPIDKTLEALVSDRQSGIFTVSLLFSVFSSSAVFTTIIKGMERIYGLKAQYGFFRRQQIALELVVIVSIALTVVFSLIIFGYEFESVLENKYKMRWLKTTIQYARFPIAFVVMVVSTLLVYKFSLRISQKLEHILPGAMLMAVLWIALTVWFGEYVKRQSYNKAYGLLAGLIAMLVWMYANSLIFLIGAEVNWLFYRGKAALKKEITAEAKDLKSKTAKLTTLK